MYNNKIIIATGGTGGHIFPAIALKEALQKKNFQVIMLVDKRYHNFIPQGHNDTFVIDSAGSGGKLSKFKKILSIILGITKALCIIRKAQPLMVVGFGGYPSFPPCIAAFLCRIPFIIHEQNSVLGKANKILSNFAKYIAISFEKTSGIEKKYLHKVKYTGNLVRESIKNIVPLTNSSDELRVFIFGGSLGANIFSKLIPQAIINLEAQTKNKIKVIQQVRKNDVENIKNFYAEHNIKAEIKDFFNDMEEQYSKADILICRAGATTIAELLYIQKPSILIPIPNSINNHQSLNANFLQSKNCCFVLEEDIDFNIENIKLRLEQLINDNKLRESMKSAYNKIDKVDSVNRLIDLIQH